jgi:hypothetical protein
MAAIFQLRRGSGSIDNTIFDGELYVNKGPDSLQYSVGDGNPITLAKLDELNTGSLYLKGGISASGDITASNMYVSGNVVLGGTITIGDTTNDSVIFNADLSSSIIPDATNTYDLGSTSKVYRNVYANSVSASSFTGSLFGMGDPTSFSTSVDLRLDRMEASASLYDNAMSGSKRLYVSPEGFDTNDGKDPSTPFKTIKAAVESLYPIEPSNPFSSRRYTIFVGSGNYTEQNPIVVPPGVAIVGDTLRTVRLTASNPTKDFFHVHDSNYFYGLRFLDLKYPAFAFSFPSSTATGSISAGGISSIGVVHSMTGYTDGNNQDLGIVIEGPDASGSITTATANVVGGVITQINVVNAGTNYVSGEKPHISIPAPLSQRPVITTSPYVQNCSSITGPFNTSGVKVLQALPYDEATFNIDEQGAGGGIRIDGNLVHPTESPLESFVADAFTQVNQGGPGHLVINKGYAQFVSCFTTFCTYGFKTANGGFANISNSVIDFGKEGLVSKTYFPQTYNTGSSLETKNSQVSGFIIDENGSGYTGSIVAVTISAPTGPNPIQATAEATVNANGSIDEVVLINPGSGYTIEPTVTIALPSEPGGIRANTKNLLNIPNKGLISGISEILIALESGSRGIDISSNMILNGVDYLVTDVAAVGGQPNQRRVTTYPAPPSITTNDQIKFHQLSNISTGGLVMEYVGSGVTYNALPKYGGVPNRTREIIEFAPGRVFYSTVDNIGNLKIGDFFSVNQLTGEVTIDANSFNLSGLNAIGPFRRNGVAVGVVLQEVSNNTTLLNSQGLFGEDTVPTQYAVKEYVQAINTSLDARIDKLEIASGSLNTFSGSTLTRLGLIETSTGSLNAFSGSTLTRLGLIETSTGSINSYTASLKQAITVTGTDASSTTTIKGNLVVQGTQTTLDSTTIQLGDNIIELNGSGITNGGLLVKDPTSPNTLSGSLLWDSTLDYWKGGTLGNESKLLLAGGDGVLSGSTDFSAFSTSVNSRLSQLETVSASVSSSIGNLNSTTASLSSSVGNLNRATASLFTSSSLMTASISLLTSSVAALQAFSGNVNTRFDNLQTYTTSVNSRFTTLETYTGSVNDKFGVLGQVTSSLLSYTSSANSWSGTIDNKFATLQLYTASVNQTTLSLNEFTQSINTKFNNLQTYTSSINSNLASIHQTTSSLNVATASLNTWTSSTFTAYSNSVEIRLDDLEYTASISVGAGLAGEFTKLHEWTSSAKISIANLETFSGSTLIRLTNLESTSASINAWSSSLTNTFATDAEVAAGYESKGRGIVSGSSQIVPLLPIGVVSGSIQILGGSGVWSGSAQMPAGVVSGSSQIVPLLPTGVVSGSSQILGGSTIHSGSIGDYQFNSIGVGMAASTTAGRIDATNDIVAFSSSDKRFKENITPIENALEKINQIGGYEFDWNEETKIEHGYEGHDLGVIAQEIEAIAPELVQTRENGYKAVKYDKLVSVLIQAIKELSAKIDKLENK